MSRPEALTLADLKRPDCPPTLKVRQVAPLFDMSSDTLYQAVAAGKPLPFRVLRLGRVIRIPTADVARALGVEASGAEPDE
jgi:hypothetical protein